MAKKDDFYSVLGITRDAKEPDIKKAYRRMARKSHPDVNPGDKSAEERFKKYKKPMMFSATLRSAQCMTNTGFIQKTSKSKPGVKAEVLLKDFPMDSIFPEWILANQAKAASAMSFLKSWAEAHQDVLIPAQ
jgi:hypothetical protein